MALRTFPHILTLLILLTCFQLLYSFPQTSFLSSNKNILLQNDERRLEKDAIQTEADSLPKISHFISLIKQGSYFGTWKSLSGSKIEGFENEEGIFMMESSQSSQKGSDSDRIFQPDMQESMQAVNFPISNPFAFLEDRIAHASTNPSKNTNTDIDPPLRVTFKIFDGQYLDQQSLRVYYFMNSTKLALSNTAVISDHAIVKKSLNWHEQDLNREECPLKLSISFLNKDNLKPYQGSFNSVRELAIKVSMESEECGIKLEAPFIRVGGFIDEIGVISYNIASCSMTLLNMVGIYFLNKRLKRKIEMYNISLSSLWLVIALDYYLLIVSMVLILSYSYLITVAFALNLLLTFGLEKNLMTRILQKRPRRASTQPYEGDAGDCQSCTWQFGLAALFFIFQLVFVLMYELWILYLTALVLTPQIVNNFKKNSPYRFNSSFIWLVVVPKTIMIAYLKLYPRNIFRISPNKNFVITFALLLLLQIVILTIQTKFPTLGFHFAKRKESRMLTDDDICPICMGHLACSNMDISPTLPRRPTIETSCTHSFHVPCLRKWASAKTECPLCRNNIEDVLEELELSDEE